MAVSEQRKMLAGPDATSSRACARPRSRSSSSKSLARLAGGSDDEFATMATLARKVTSSIGLAEVIPVRRSGNGIEPLASKYLPLSALARADGWILVPAESEGYPAGTSVAVRAWP